jgi:tRNA A-37 threonylcarbamoyl transferase component Bud32
MSHTPVTKEFQDEALRLALTSGRSWRENEILRRSQNYGKSCPIFR